VFRKSSVNIAQPPQTNPTQVSSAGVISGTVTGADGTSIVGGSVTLQLQTPLPKRGQTQWATVTGPGGSFQFERLNQGSYVLCALAAPGTAWLDPCEWGAQPSAVALSSTQTAASVAVVLLGGAVVPIRVNDPAQLLPQNEGTTPGAHLLLGFANDRAVFRPAPLISQDAAGRNYQIVIPFNHPVNLAVVSSFFQLTNATGITLPRTGAIIPVAVPSGQQPPIITLAVTGGGG
jgi:hypothetical protein